MSNINPDALDVDFTKCREFVRGDLGLRSMFAAATYEDQFPLLTDQEIEQAIDRQEEQGGSLDLLVTRIYDQGQEGSCVANATCGAHEAVQAKQYGKANVVHLSAISLYKRIGRSPSSGAYVQDGWEELAKRGALPLDTPENRARFGDAVMDNTGFYDPFPANWEATAIMLAGLEATPITSLHGLKSAMCAGHPVVVGRDGHSIWYARLMRDRGRHVAKYTNSWSPGWGDAGFGYDSESKIAESARWAFALRSVRVES